MFCQQTLAKHWRYTQYCEYYINSCDVGAYLVFRCGPERVLSTNFGTGDWEKLRVAGYYTLEFAVYKSRSFVRFVTIESHQYVCSILSARPRILGDTYWWYWRIPRTFRSVCCATESSQYLERKYWRSTE